MKILKQLVEMDPMMRPIGGPVPPHNLPAPPEQEEPEAAYASDENCECECGTCERCGKRVKDVGLMTFIKFLQQQLSPGQTTSPPTDYDPNAKVGM